MEEATAQAAWWGSYDLEAGDVGYWLIGGFEMWTRRTEREWQVFTRHGGDPLAGERAVEVPSSRGWPDGDGELRRFAFRRTQSTIEILPALADRGVVLLPGVAFSIPPREECTLYISTPLWVTLLLGSSTPILDIPCHRPSDTWFGPNTITGEVCYSSKTRASQSLENVTRVPHRAISVVKIRNRAATKLQFERMNLPVRNLTLFADASGNLWTESVTLERAEDGDFADLKLGKGAPEEAGKGTRSEAVRPPREKPERGLPILAFGNLLR